jgi:hypothetical protein
VNELGAAWREGGREEGRKEDAPLVEVVVEVLVHLLGVPVLAEESAKDSSASEPHDLHRQAGIGRTLAFPVA